METFDTLPILRLKCARKFAFGLFAMCLLFPRLSTADDDERHTINVGNMNLVVTNYGTVGLAFAERGRHSCEYPKGSHIEHLYIGGLWVGGIRNNEIRVTTGAIDVSRKPDGAAEGFEYTTGACYGTPTSFPADSIYERSLLPVSQYYDPQAVSHQDFISAFTDSNICIPQSAEEIPNHRPLGITVRQHTYAWSQSFADAYVIFEFTIRNSSPDVIQSPYVGYWIDTMVGNTDLNPPPGWGPSYSWRWYDDGNNYVDSLQMAYEFDYDGDFGYAESYVGMRILGTEPAFFPDSAAAGDTISFLSKTNFYEWLFRNNQDPVFFMPQTDVERFDHMATGLNDYQDWRSWQSAVGALNRSMLISTGPFPDMAPGDSIKFIFSIVCADKTGPNPMEDDTELSRRNLLLSSYWSKISYVGEDQNENGILDPGEDVPPYNNILDRYKLPEPPPPPNVKLVAGESKIDVYWDNSAESFIDPVTGQPDFEGYNIYRARITQDNQNVGLAQLLELSAQYDLVDSVGYNTGLGVVALAEPETLDGRAYHYKFTNDNLLNGWQYLFAVTAFDRGDPANNLESLESSKLLSLGRAFPGPNSDDAQEVAVFPNPYRASSLWDGRGDDGIHERSRLLYFANLPDRCTIKIYTLAGDLVDTIEHDGISYSGGDINWYDQYAPGDRVFSGGIHAWDLVTKSDQALATGMYLFTVENINSGELSRGKFVVIK
jgi:hypothetical protein